MATGTRDPAHQAVQEQRRRWLHALVHDTGGYMGVKQIVEAAAKRRGWPPATWVGARKGPPDYQQVRNYVTRLVRDGKLSESVVNGRRQGLFCSVATPDQVGLGMRKRAADALALQKGGLNQSQIAERLGISVSLASSLVNDPYGEKERERKKRYCPVCGGKKSGDGAWCGKCNAAPDPNDLLPPRDFLAIARRVQREFGTTVVFGVTEDFVRVIRIGTDRGVLEHRLPSGQSWDEAVEELSLL